MRATAVVVLVGVGVFGTLAGPALATAPFFVGLEDLPGGSPGNQASAISADGGTAVGWSGSARASIEACRWQADGHPVAVGDLDGGLFQSSAVDVSADARILVGYGTDEGGTQPCRWTADGVVAALGQVSNPGQTPVSGVSLGVSADGSVVVGKSGHRAFRWSQPTGMVALGDLDGGEGDAAATGVSGDGSIVVGTSTSPGYDHQAFRWTQETGTVGLGDLTGGYVGSEAYGISADGKVVVGASYSDRSEGWQEAFRWTESEGMVGLGDLPGGIFSSRARAASADGSVIVGDSDGGGPGGVFIWDSVHGMRNLLDVLTEECGLDLQGWSLMFGTDVSADGLTIVGIAVDPEGGHGGYIAHIPEPATLLLLALASLTLMRRRQR